MNFSRRSCPVDLAESGALNVTIRIAEIRVVEDVKELASELKPKSLAKQEVFKRREIDIVVPGTGHVIPSEIPECEWRGRSERRRIEPFEMALAESRRRIADQLRALAAASNVRRVAAAGDAKRLA